MPTFYRFDIKWSVSRGRDTYGYNICTVRDSRGARVATSYGGGYDMVGTVLGETLSKLLPERLSKLGDENMVEDPSNPDRMLLREDDGKGNRVPRLYGMSRYRDKRGRWVTYVDGACGCSSMERIAEAMGVRVEWACDAKGRRTGFTLIDEKEGAS